MNLSTIICLSIRAQLVQNGPMTLSEVVKALNLDPTNCKRTIHSLMVEMEREGVLSSTRNLKTKKREHWAINPSAIRKRDRIAALFS